MNIMKIFLGLIIAVNVYSDSYKESLASRYNAYMESSYKKIGQAVVKARFDSDKKDIIFEIEFENFPSLYTFYKIEIPDIGYRSGVNSLNVNENKLALYIISSEALFGVSSSNIILYPHNELEKEVKPKHIIYDYQSYKKAQQNFKKQEEKAEYTNWKVKELLWFRSLRRKNG